VFGLQSESKLNVQNVLRVSKMVQELGRKEAGAGESGWRMWSLLIQLLRPKPYNMATGRAGMYTAASASSQCAVDCTPSQFPSAHVGAAPTCTLATGHCQQSRGPTCPTC
jgi:hypothetical protein